MNTGAGAKSLQRTKKMVTLAVMAAIAYVAMVFIRIPAVEFLKYEPKDVIITLAGFIYGPLSAFAISVVVSLLEMVTVSTTGPVGMLMNILSTCAFACTASFIYKRRQKLSGAVIGLVAGIVLTVAVMIPWNYFMTPYYMPVTREVVATMLLPVFLPFNLIKTSLNAALLMLLYKPVVTALRKAHLVPPSSGGDGSAKTGGFKLSLGVALVSLLVLASAILAVLVFQGVI